MKTKPDWNLLTKYINNECKKKEIVIFEQWLSESNENQQYFNQIKDAWGAYGVNQISFSPDKKEAWRKIDRTFGENKFKARSIIIWSARIAASIIILIGLSYIVNNTFIKQNNQDFATVITEKTSSSKKLVLPDGTFVWLNKSTTIKYPKEFAQNERHVYLSGEAFFEVSKNVEQPFIIESENTITKVVGTSFNLRAYEDEDEVKLIVNSGKVVFYSKMNGNNKVILTKDLAGLFNKKKNTVLITDVFDVNYQSWKTGKLFFYNTCLSDVCLTLENQYNRKIILLDPELKNMKIIASFNNQKFEEVIDIISQTLDIKYQVKNDSVQFSLN